MNRTIGTFMIALFFLIALALGGMPLTAGAKEAAPIVIGVPTSLGFVAGKEALNATILAAEEINAAGGISLGGKKHKLEVVSQDIRDGAPGVPVSEALLGIEKMILEKKVNAVVVGPWRSEALLAAMDIFAKYKIPMMGTIAMSPATEAKIKKDPAKYKYVFRVGLNAVYFVKYQVGSMMFLKKQFGFDRVFIMNQDVLWANKSAEIISKVLGKNGWKVLGSEAYPTGASDFSTGLIKAGGAGAQVILPIFDMPTSGILVKLWKSMNLPAVMAGYMTPLTGPDAWKAFEGKIAGAMNAIFEVGNIPVSKMPATVKFYQAYTKRWGHGLQGGHGPAPAYDAVYILKNAIEKAGALDPDKVVSAIQATEMDGVIGHIKFSPTNQVIYGFDPQKTAMGCVIQFSKQGKQEVVFPPSIANAKVMLPPGLKPVK